MFSIKKIPFHLMTVVLLMPLHSYSLSVLKKVKGMQLAMLLNLSLTIPQKVPKDNSLRPEML